MRWLLRNVIRDIRFDAIRKMNPKGIVQRPIIGGKVLPPNGSKYMRMHDFTPEVIDQIEKHTEAGNVELIKMGRSGCTQDLNELRELCGFPIDAIVVEKEIEFVSRDLPEGTTPEEIKDIYDKHVTEIFKNTEVTLTDIEPVSKPFVSGPPEGTDPRIAHLWADRKTPTNEDVVEALEALSAEEDVSPGEPNKDDEELELPSDGELDAVEEELEEDPLDPDDLLEEEEEDVPYTELELMGHNKDDLILIHKSYFEGQKMCSTGKSKQKLADDILADQAGA